MKHASSAKIGPLVDRVVVRSLEEAEHTRGGLFIPESAKEKPQQGEIVAVGPGRFDEGKRVPMDVKVGDKVLYGKYSGSEVTIDGERLLILSESDVLAIIGRGGAATPGSTSSIFSSRARTAWKQLAQHPMYAAESMPRTSGPW